MSARERIRPLIFGLVLVTLAIVAAAACGDDDDDAGGDGDGASTVAVTLKEFEVVPDNDSVSAGAITFKASNTGPEDAHELVVVKTDLAPDELPTSDDGSADEEGEGVELIGEIAEFAVGAEAEATFNLTAGKYVLLCNVVEELEGGETESHYKNGMRTAFTVE
jgi:uncharacterized cupredoxin-like copper-binding protein